MGLPTSILSEDINVLKAKNTVFLVLVEGTRPVVMITVSRDNSCEELSQITDSLFGQQKVDMAFFNISFDVREVKKRIEQLMTTVDPVVNEVMDSEGEYGKIIKVKPVFSNRELEILQLIALEYTNEQIADKLCLAKRTVDNHRVNLMQRANAKNTAGLIGFAFRNGLVK